MNLDLRRSERIRDSVARQQRKEIQRLYQDIAQKIRRELHKAPKDTVTGKVERVYLQGLQREITERLRFIEKELQITIPQNMAKVSRAVVEDNIAFAKGIGLEVAGRSLNVPDDVVQSILSGKVYDREWSFSKAIWRDLSKKTKDINNIVAKGIAENRSTLEIAQDLEKYVRPSAAKPWDWSKVYPGSAKKIDYNAQRLARTLAQHAYQQSLLRSVRYNPFVEGIEWLASNGGRTCELCMSRDGVVYPKDALPMDHPNGMCTFVAAIPYSSVEVADRIGDWYNGKSDPELDRFSKWL